ncbi:MAG: MoaD/ThiS family protein [Nanoarchaeota archaeon]
MKLTIFNERTQTTTAVQFKGNTVTELLNHLSINPETVIVLRKEEVITAEETLQEGEELYLLSVISGG